MNLSTSEPCVGFLHLAAAFPRVAAVVGCIGVGAIAFPLTNSGAATTCLAQSGQIYEAPGEGGVCVIDPPPMAFAGASD